MPATSWPRLYLNSCLTCLTQVLPAFEQTAKAVLPAWVLQCLTMVPHAQPMGARDSYSTKLVLTPAFPYFIISPSDRNLFGWWHQNDYSLWYDLWRKDVLEQRLPLFCLLCKPAAYSLEINPLSQCETWGIGRYACSLIDTGLASVVCSAAKRDPKFDLNHKKRISVSPKRNGMSITLQELSVKHLQLGHMSSM